jgi:hypothetical protein
VKQIELIVELPPSDETELPEAEIMPRGGPVATVWGLNGDQVLQVAIIVTAGSVEVLRAWLLARAERLKHTRVVWHGREFTGYTPKEIELLMQTLHRALDDDADSGDLPSEN